MSYRLLKPGEITKEGDEILLISGGNAERRYHYMRSNFWWDDVRTNITVRSTYKPIRRRI